MRRPASIQPSTVTQGTGQPRQIVASISAQSSIPVGGVGVTFTVTNTKPASLNPQAAPKRRHLDGVLRLLGQCCVRPQLDHGRAPTT